MASPSDPPTDRAGDTEQFPVTRVSTAAAATDTADVPSTGGPAHAVTAGTPGISRAGWWAITIAAAVLLVLGFLLTFGPARYWTPVPVVFLGYFLLSGVTGLVFWKGVRELRDSNPTLHSGDGPATPGARVAAAIGAVGVASALVLLPAGLSDAPANAAPCPDGSNTCGPQPTMGPQPTQGNGGNTTAPQAPNTTVPGYTPPDTPPQQGNGSTPTVQGQVPTMPTGDSPSNGCIFSCGPTQAPQAPQTGQATPPQTGQNPATTAPNTPATTPQAPTTTPRLRTPTPETTTSTTSSKARDRDDDQQHSSDEDRDKNSPYPYQAAEIAALAGTYRRKKLTETAVRDGQVVSENATRTLYTNATAVSKPVQGRGVAGGGGRIPDPAPGSLDPSKLDPEPPSGSYPPPGGANSQRGEDGPVHIYDNDPIGVGSMEANSLGQLVYDQDTGTITFRNKATPKGPAFASMVTATVNGKPWPVANITVAGQTYGGLAGIKPGDLVRLRQKYVSGSARSIDFYQLDGDLVPIRTPKVGDSEGGPGRWVKENGNTKGAYYQEAVTFVKAGYTYLAGGKKFDSYEAGRLLEAKGQYDWMFDKNGKVYDFIKDKNNPLLILNGEAAVAQALGLPLDIFAQSPKAFQAFSEALAGLPGVSVKLAPQGRVG